ncbi:MAG: hypothetical protein ACR2PR_08860 [Pseudohongiellaceae bacterium]
MVDILAIVAAITTGYAFTMYVLERRARRDLRESEIRFANLMLDFQGVCHERDALREGNEDIRRNYHAMREQRDKMAAQMPLEAKPQGKRHHKTRKPK